MTTEYNYPKSTITLNIYSDEAEAILITMLKNDLHNLIKDGTLNLFSLDEKENQKKVKKLLKAYKRVLEYYGEEVVV
jgi:transcriptional regulator of heat shock response